MLIISQVAKLYSEFVTIKFKNKPHPNGLKGEYAPSELEVIVYKPAIESKKDEGITILHEFVHARDDIKAARLARAECYGDKAVQRMEQKTEEEAIDTYKKRPVVLEFIKQMYKIK